MSESKQTEKVLNNNNQSYNSDSARKEKSPRISSSLNLKPINSDHFSEYAYSKNSHFEFFHANNYDNILFGREIDPKNSVIKNYQELLIYSFITHNISTGSRILGVGKDSDLILRHFKLRYECFAIEDAGQMKESFNNLQNKIKMVSARKGNVKNLITGSYFDFIFSISAFAEVDEDSKVYNNILSNIMYLLRKGGYSLHCFKAFSGEGIDLVHSRLLNYLNIYASPQYLDVQRYHNIPEKENILTDKHLHYTTEYFSSEKNSLKDKISKTISRNFLWRKNPSELPLKTFTTRKDYLENNPVYIFHHLMKCGGTSVKEILKNWFNVEYDYLEEYDNLNSFLKFKLNSEILNSDYCIAGHFQFDGIFLHQRYREIIDNKNFRIFTFVRDPLSFRASLYYYSRKRISNMQKFKLKDVILNDMNLMSNLFPCDETNYKKVLDRYFFIGIVEQMQVSLDKFADLIYKKRQNLPMVNISEKDSQIEDLTPQVLGKFKDQNRLDYLIYDYCREKFEKLIILTAGVFFQMVIY